MGERKESYSLINGRNVKLPTLSVLQDIERYRRRCSENSLMLHSLQRQEENNVNIALSEIYLNTKGRVSSSHAMVLQEMKQYLPQNVCHERLNRATQMNWPPCMTATWKKIIWDRIPKKILTKFSSVNAELEREVNFLYEKTLQSHGICERIKPSPAEKQHYITIKEYRKGISENYSQYLTTTTFIEHRLLLTHSLMVKVLEMSVTHVPWLLNDYTKYRSMGPLSLISWKTNMSNDLRRGENLLQQGMYNKIAKLFLKQSCLDDVPREYWPQFMKCTTYIMVNQIIELKKRTLDNVINMTGDVHRVPHLKIDLVYEEDKGILLSPSQTEIVSAFLEIVDDIAGIAEKLDPLESWVSVPVPPGYINVKVLEEHIKEAKQIIQRNILKLYHPVENYRQELVDKFNPLYEIALQLELEVFISSENKKFNESYDKILYLKIFYYRIMELSSNKVFNVVRVNQIDVIKNMMSIYSNYSSRILSELLVRHQEQNRRICEKFEQLACRALTSPKSTEELMEMGKYMIWATSTFMEQIKEEIHRVIMEFCHMIDMTTFTEEHINLNTETVLWLHNIKPVFQQNAMLYEQYKIKFEEDLTKMTDLLVKKIEDLFPRLSVLDMMDDANKVDEYIPMIRWFCRKLEDFVKTIAWINKEESLFQFPYSTYPELDELKAFIHPFGELIFLIHKWHRTYKLWMDGDFDFIEALQVEEKTKGFHQDLEKTLKMYRERLRQQATESYPRRFKGNVEDPEFVNLPAPVKLCMKAIDHIRDFQQNIGLAKIMCNPALMQRHWDEMSEIAGLDLTPDAGTTLRKIINMKLEKYLEKFEVISISAMKEKQLKENLMKMLHEWTEIKFTVIMWKDTDVLILTELAEIEAIMDDHLVKTLSMRGSAFVKPLEGEVLNWYLTLIRMIKTIDEWGKVQMQWLYLLPFFSSPNIISEIPEEGLLFNDVDSIYKTLMASVKNDPRVTETAGVLGTYESLHTCTENLEKVNSGLSVYLENKRLFFPRFFFLSNCEMLEILSKTKDPLKVQPHLNKIFEGVNELAFDEHLCIKAMYSGQGEKIDFMSPVYTNAARGSVEKWLSEVEKQLIASVRNEIMKSYTEYPKSELMQWVLQWPGQAVLCVSLIYWTSRVHELLRPNALDSLRSYFHDLQTQLNEIVALVCGKLSSQARITLGSFIVLHAHTKDIVSELINKEVSSRKDFQWLAHLRYYWEQDVKVCIVNATENYAYEYLGNTTRLVVTPLTDRCYRTLVGAHHLHLNGAPEGSAGTGKTETVKDLAKALAVRCIVFNCSDGLNYITMGKFFKGIASSGSWACFDEFNRIEVDVLSVIAQQILTITQAVRTQLKNVLFEGMELRLNPTCFVCITMNPECTARSELPDNLKVLFRLVAMMIPDIMLISEISLYSFGFMNARHLAEKIITTCHLCSAQLSSHSHYDYGLKAVKCVLETAGNLKLDFPHVEEESLILRSLIDSNISKLVTQDIPVFEGMILDLFPAAVLPTSNHNNLLLAAREICKIRFLQPTEFFLLKLVQTYEMMTMYHGFVLIGDSFGGKSSILKVLADALSLISKKEESEKAVMFEIINPKCLTLAQLYGHFDDDVSHDWIDGVVSQTFRMFSTDKSDARKWIIFDGPVDSSWIENMNTVLDDSKKLCLTSGEVIHQTKYMSMIFEVTDLAQASPATVSRCGMIHMESSTLGWKPLVLSWIDKGNPAWRDGNEKLLEDLFDWLVPPCLDFIKRNCVQIVTPGVNNQINSATSLIHMLLEEAVQQNEDTKPVRSWIQAAFLFAGMWSFGGILDADSQIKFDEFYRSIWKGCSENYHIPESIEKIEISVPMEGMLYDYVYHFKLKGNWKYWPEVLKGIKIEETVNIQSPIPTTESLRYKFLMDIHIRNNLPVLLVGPSGTGKTFYIRNILTYKLSDEKYIPAYIPFTSQTTGNQTQELFISKLNKQGKNCYGPSNGKKCIIFIDDMDMPAKQIYGAQSAIELLRQFFDHGHWYDLKTKSKIYILDVLILAAMGLPGGCRQEIYQRCLRHFSIYSVNQVSTDSISRIYTNILLISLKRNGFATDVMSTVVSIINATLDIYQGAVSHLLPTPAKCHYTFNLRDFSRVIQGCVLMKKESLDNKKLFVRIWVHEVLRVFYDRLVEAEDRTWLYDKLRHNVEEHFSENFDVCLDTLPMENGKVTEDSLRQLLFGNFMNPNASVEERRYEEITSLDALTRVAEIALTEYNVTHKPNMDIVLFRYALEHLCRICRIIAMPSGSGLLIGVGGSGRQSLTRLAAAIHGTLLYQPEITKNYGVNEWKHSLKKILREAGAFAKETTFLLSDSQLKEEEFLQDIDSLLNCGEVPNLYSVDEQQEILEIVRLTAQGGNRNLDISALSVFSFFINRCKEKLHLILCFSPIGSSLRRRLLLYPTLVNCCTIDWFTTWPEDALEMVAQRYMVDVNLHFEIKSAAVSACKYFHVSAREISEEFLAQEGRKSYITSASYLELIHTFTHLISEKQNEIMQAKLRYIGGLDKLDFAAEQVAAMQQELSELKPQLVLAAERTRSMMKEIEKETIKVGAASNQVREDEKVANIQAAKAQELKIECEADLAQAIPILEDAVAALNTLKPTDITLVKSMKNPPDAIKLVMAAVCVMKNVKADRIIDSSTGRMVNDYWGPSKRVLGDMYFLQSLKEFDKDNIAPSIMKKIRTEYLPNKDFKPSVVAKASSAAEGLCKWVIAMDMYDKVAKEVSPKKAKLEIAEAEYNATMALLEEKRNQLRTLEEQLADLHHKLNEANQRKQALEDDVTLCANKLKRAEKLIGGLGGEKARWSAAADALQKDYDSLAGDILICCGVICYLSPFTSSYRNKCIDGWKAYVSDLNIPRSQEFSFRKVLGSDIKIQAWYIASLPNDSLSIENAIIVDKSRRYSLLVDPQGQARKWIKALEKSSGLKTVKCTNNDFTKTLHNCIEFGYPLLLENVGEILENALDPLLMKQVFQQGERQYIKLGETVLEFNPKFRLYLISKLRNPHFMPDVFNKVTVVNFVLTLEGLENQLLGIVVAKERPDLEKTRQNLIVQSAANETALKDVEDGILITLSETKGNILEDESAINVLDSSKALAQDITEKEAKAKESASMIENFRSSFRPVARHSAILYYCLTDLPNIDPMYQYSLEWFINLYNNSIERSNKARSVDKRTEFIADTFTYNLYTNVSLSLFEKDKLLFSFILCTNILMAKKKLNLEEFQFFITGISPSENMLENPEPSWLPSKCWNAIFHLDNFPSFKGFLHSFRSSLESWKNYYTNENPLEINLPKPWDEKLSNFQKLIIIKMFHPDKILLAIQNFIVNEMGSKYVTPPMFDIAKSFVYSNCLFPLIFILSPGADPMASLMAFSRKLGKNLQVISLGQGQGLLAQKVIKEGQEGGHWVCLQNCHLAASWMPVLEKLWEEMNINNTSLNFRLWLTSFSSDKFPTGILQAGVKMTNELPTGLQQNLLWSFLSEPIKQSEFFSGCPGKEKEFSKLLYGLCFFHAVVQERKKFGAIGWNIPYGFDESDFQISLQQLQLFLNDYETVPFETILYLIGECNYGGRVTDDWDRRTLNIILTDFINEKLVLDEEYTFTNVGNTYGLPYHCEYRHFLHHIKEIPSVPPPEVFGLHTNSGITKDLHYGKKFFVAVLEVYGWMTVGNKEEDIVKTNNTLLENIKDILNKLPPAFDLVVARATYPARYEESLNAVLIKELEHLNILLNIISTSLITLQKSLKGLVLMSPELEDISHSLLMGRVPAPWAKMFFPSSKPLGGYINDFLLRLENFHKWYSNGEPSCFWLPGFFYTHSFLTAVLLNYARKFKVPVEQLSFDFIITSFDTSTDQPEEGCYIIGLFLDGARWDRESHTIQESHRRIFKVMMPAIHMVPRCKEAVKVGDRYVCPVYKTEERRGALSTIGYSNNYIIPILLNTDRPVSHWIKRGVALVCQLKD